MSFSQNRRKLCYAVLGLIFISICGFVLQNHVIATSLVSYSTPPVGYDTWSEVTLKMDYQWRIWSLTNNTGVHMWAQRFSNHSHPQLSGVAPLQSSLLLSNSTSYVPDIYYYDPVDDYNNTIEYFDFNLLIGTEFVYSISYNLSLQEISWNLNDVDVDAYNTTDPFYLNLTGAEYNLQVDNPTLRNLSNEICSGKNSIAAKVRAIVDWIVENIEYDEEMSVSQGAYLTYITRRGDCSDFTTLFVTLCRIQGIPARKVLGLAFLDNDGYSMEGMQVGEKVEYDYGYLSGNTVVEGSVPGHAWAEYYVPGYGFVSLDPTFAQSDTRKYMNYMDYIHIFSSVGENFGGGIDPVFPGTDQEFAFFPYSESTSPSSVRWALSMDIEVLEASLIERPLIPFDVGTFILAGVGVVAILGISIRVKRN